MYFRVLVLHSPYTTLFSLPSDVNECLTGANDCESSQDGGICKNTFGSYQCSCQTGYFGDGIKPTNETTNVQNGNLPGCTGM